MTPVYIIIGIADVGVGKPVVVCVGVKVDGNIVACQTDNAPGKGTEVFGVEGVESVAGDSDGSAAVADAIHLVGVIAVAAAIDEVAVRDHE